MGMCDGCEHFRYIDNGNKISCRCHFTERGKQITWAMYTYIATPFGYIQDTAEIERRRNELKEYPKKHKEPYWCPLKKK